MKDSKSPRMGKKSSKKKACSLCVNRVQDINYITLAREIEKSDRGYDKNGERRPRYITEKGKIIPRRMSGICLRHQHMITEAIKRARVMALLPYKSE